MLTLEKLKSMEQFSVFAVGTTVDSPEGINMTNSGRKLRWVAVRGGIHDWAIYCHWDEYGYDWIKQFGDKVHDEDNIRKLVPCDDESFKMYRR